MARNSARFKGVVREPQEEPSLPPPGGTTAQKQNASWVTLLIGSLGAAFTAFLVTQAEMVLSSVRIGYLQFPPAALGLLLLVTALNRVIKRISARWGLTSSDLLVIYSMSLVAAMVSSHGIVQKLIPLLVIPHYLSNNTNNWAGLYHPRMQQRQVPFDIHNPGKQLVSSAFFGKLQRGEEIPWHLWVTPVLTWGVLIVLVVGGFLCLTALLRKQWVDNERLSFPLAQLPLEIAGDTDNPAFFRNWLMWGGALIPIVVFTINGLHKIHPTIPEIQLNLSINDFLTTPPWNGIAYTPMVLSFAAVGFFFLLSTDILFSIWFFFLLARLEQVVTVAYNMQPGWMPMYPTPLFLGQQTMGAYFVLVAYFFWIARPHLKKVWASAIGREKIDDSQELMPYRVAFWGLIGCITLSALWLWSMGMSPWLAVFELVIFMFVIALVMTRSTAEGGMLMTETTFRPVDILRMFTSLHGLGAMNLTQLSFFDNLFLRDQRGLVLTGFMDTMRISDGTNVRRRSFVGIIALGAFIAFVVAVFLNIYFSYTIGGGSMDGWMEQGSPSQTFNDYQQYFQPGRGVSPGLLWQMPTFFIVGVLMAAFLTAMRAAFFWWPLHPLGYALAGSWSSIQFWFPCLLAWIFKSLCLRYGGMKQYTRARPFFLGLVVGEFGIACFYVVLNIVSKYLFHAPIPPPDFPWN